MKKIIVAAAIVFVAVGVFVSVRFLGPAQAEFPVGAFPPTLSDMDYHRHAWIQTDCVLCHDKGIQGAPILKHTSVAPIARIGQCRTCHTLIPDSKPRQ